MEDVGLRPCSRPPLEPSDSKMLEDHVEVKPEPPPMGVEEDARLRVIDV
jgi:hypothetical protein